MPIKNLDAGEIAVITEQYISVCGTEKNNFRKMRQVLLILGIKCLKTDDELQRLVTTVCMGDCLDRLLTINEFVDLVSLLKTEHCKRISKSNEDVIEAFVSLGGQEDTSGSVSTEILKSRFNDANLPADVNKMVVEAYASGKLEFGEFEFMMTDAVTSASVTDLVLRQVLDPFCLYRRLGGDPDSVDNQGTLCKATILEKLPTIGLDSIDLKKYLYFTSKVTSDFIDYDLFCREVVDRIDAGYEPFPEKQLFVIDEKKKKRNTFERRIPIGIETIDHRHDRINDMSKTQHEQSRSVNVVDLDNSNSGTTFGRKRGLSKNNYIRVGCNFPQPLMHLLFLNYPTLKLFEAKVHVNRDTMCATGLRMFSVVTKAICLLSRHRATCPACHGAIDPFASIPGEVIAKTMFNYIQHGHMDTNTIQPPSFGRRGSAMIKSLTGIPIHASLKPESQAHAHPLNPICNNDMEVTDVESLNSTELTVSVSENCEGITVIDRKCKRFAPVRPSSIGRHLKGDDVEGEYRQTQSLSRSGLVSRYFRPNAPTNESSLSNQSHDTEDIPTHHHLPKSPWVGGGIRGLEKIRLPIMPDTKTSPSNADRKHLQRLLNKQSFKSNNICGGFQCYNGGDIRTERKEYDKKGWRDYKDRYQPQSPRLNLCHNLYMNVQSRYTPVTTLNDVALKVFRKQKAAESKRMKEYVPLPPSVGYLKPERDDLDLDLNISSKSRSVISQADCATRTSTHITKNNTNNKTLSTLPLL